jgi:beta-glucosidase
MSLETITSKMTLTGQAEPESAPTDKDKPLIDIDAVLPQLTLHEKIALLSGTDFWHTYAVERLGIPPIRLSDGPNGVRGTKFFAGTPSACFPCGTALASTWSTTLLRSCGSLMAEEAKAKGASVILGPTVNMQRSPLGGRGFESFSEDPVLSGLCARGVVQGMQGEGVAACVKHFVGNDQEHERQAVSSIISERALREIYLMPFQLACGAGAGQGASGTEGEGNEERPWAVMTAYNRVNGLHCSESPRLINDILRKEWGWDGLVMSDWYGTYSTAEALNAGLDLEMPGPAKMRGEMVTYALGAKKVSERTIDERVRNVLGLVNRVQGAGVQPYAVEGTNDTPETRAKLREVAAEAIVLLKNDNNILPFDKTKTVSPPMPRHLQPPYVIILPSFLPSFLSPLGEGWIPYPPSLVLLAC